MITLIQVLDVGNALRIYLQPPAGATAIRLLRKTADDFTGADDAQATQVEIDRGYDAPLIAQPPEAFEDVQGLLNGQLYYYRPYYAVAGVWQAGETAAATPAANYYRDNVDPLETLRTRLRLGMQDELSEGRFRHPDGAIPVLTAPPKFEDTRFPVISVHLQNDAPEARGIGEFVAPWDEDGDITPTGWLSRHSIDVMVWSLNPDERIALRRAVKRIVLANAAVFDRLGMQTIEFSQSDTEDTASYNAPVYMTQGLFSCLAPFEVNAGHYDTAVAAFTTECIHV